MTDTNQPTAAEVKMKWAAAIAALLTAVTTLGKFLYAVYRNWRARQQQNQQPPADTSGQ